MCAFTKAGSSRRVAETGTCMLDERLHKGHLKVEGPSLMSQQAAVSTFVVEASLNISTCTLLECRHSTQVLLHRLSHAQMLRQKFKNCIYSGASSLSICYTGIPGHYFSCVNFSSEKLMCFYLEAGDLP